MELPITTRTGWTGRFRTPVEVTEAEVKARVFGLLASLGAVALTVEYGGLADEGAIDEISWRGPDDAAIELPPHARQAVEDFVYESLPCGWEIDAGGCGSVEFDIAEGTVLLRHTQRFVDSSDSEWEV